MIKKKILVTGGTGFIGSHTAVELIEKGFKVFIIDSLVNSHAEVINDITKITGVLPSFYHIDICNSTELEYFFKTEQVDAVIHFAALKAVGESAEKPLLYYRNNILSLLNLADMCMNYGIENFVFSSSCSVYGEPDELPVSEQASLKQPESPYANTKKISEEILKDATLTSPLKVISLRYFNPAGAHTSSIIGENPAGKPSNLMPLITQTAIGKNDTLEIFGNDYSTPDGSCIRDYIHVQDLAEAHVMAVERLLNNHNKEPFEVFNLGSGRGYSVFEMIKSFLNLTGQKLNYKISPRRKGDVEKVYADITKAGSEMGWKAKRSLEDIIETAWNWEKELSIREKMNASE